MDPKLFETIFKYKVHGSYESDLSKAQKTEIRRKVNNYEVEGQELLYVKGQGRDLKLKVVCGATKANEIFLAFHASASGGHTGQKKTQDAISLCFCWPGMTGDIDKWVSECEVCQSAGYKIKDTSEHTPIQVSHPFELIGIIGKIKTTKRGYQYICVMMNYYTKWTQAYPITSKTAEEVTKQILKFVFSI